MSDSNRKSIRTQVAEKATPDSQKTTGQKFKESVTNAMDRAAAKLTPDSKKSSTQKAADSINYRDHDHTHNHTPCTNNNCRHSDQEPGMHIM